MALEQVKFKRGTQEQYNTAVANNEIDENALYFITDTHRLFLGLNEISTPIKLNGDYTGDVENIPNEIPSGNNPPSNLTTELQTGEITLGAAASKNILTYIGDGRYYSTTGPEAFGHKYIPTAGAIVNYLKTLGTIKYQGEYRGNLRSLVVYDLLDNDSSGITARWMGEDTVLSNQYIDPNQIVEGQDGILVHKGDFLITKFDYTEHDAPVLKVHIVESLTHDSIRQAMATNDAMVFKGTIGNSEVVGTISMQDLVGSDRKTGDTFKVIADNVVLDSQYNFENNSVVCKNGDLLVFAGWWDSESNFFTTKPTDDQTYTPKIYYVPSADEKPPINAGHYLLTISSEEDLDTNTISYYGEIVNDVDPDAAVEITDIEYLYIQYQAYTTLPNNFSVSISNLTFNGVEYTSPLHLVTLIDLDNCEEPAGFLQLYCGSDDYAENVYGFILSNTYLYPFGAYDNNEGDILGGYKGCVPAPSSGLSRNAVLTPAGWAEPLNIDKNFVEYKGTVGTDGTIDSNNLFKTNTPASIGQVYKVIEENVTLPSAYSSDNTEHTLHKNETVIYLGEDKWEYTPSVYSVRNPAPWEQASSGPSGNLDWGQKSGDIILGTSANLDYAWSVGSSYNSQDDYRVPTVNAMKGYANGFSTIQKLVLELPASTPANNELTLSISDDGWEKLNKQRLFVIQVKANSTSATKLRTSSTSASYLLTIKNLNGTTTFVDKATMIFGYTKYNGGYNQLKFNSIGFGTYLCYLDSQSLVSVITTEASWFGASSAGKNFVKWIIKGANSTTTMLEASVYPFQKGTTSSPDGAAGIVPGPASTDNNKFLSSEGKWKNIDMNISAIAGDVIRGEDSGAPFNDMIVLEHDAHLGSLKYVTITFNDDYTTDSDRQFNFFFPDDEITSGVLSGASVIPKVNGESVYFIPKGVWMWKCDGGYASPVGYYPNTEYDGLRWGEI